MSKDYKKNSNQKNYILKLPDNRLPVIFDSPHSGRNYPDNFNYACPLDELMQVEDRYVDDLFSSAPDKGAALLYALFPRSYIDVNRAIDDIDLKLLGKFSWPEDILLQANPGRRSQAGIGLVSRLIMPGKPIYNRDLSPNEIINRIEKYYIPYHKALETVIDENHYKYGKSWHINCHSMPAASSFPKHSPKFTGYMQKACDFVLGNRGGTSCSKDFTHYIRDYLKKCGFYVTINDPFQGVELVRKYSCPGKGLNSLQIEINRSLYMNELTGEKLRDYNEFQEIIDGLIDYILQFAVSEIENTEIAAD